MNEDIFSGKWHQLKGKIKEKWGKLTDDDLTKINGKRELLQGALQEKYGWQKQRAEEELKRFEQSCKSECCSKGEKPHTGCCSCCGKDSKGCCCHKGEGGEDTCKKRKTG